MNTSGALPQPDQTCDVGAAQVADSGRGSNDGDRSRSRWLNRPKRLVTLAGLCLRPEPVMTLPRTLADVLDRHVTFEIESIDRIYGNVNQHRLRYPKRAAAFFHFHRGHTFASSALMAPMTKMFVTAIALTAPGPPLAR